MHRSRSKLAALVCALALGAPASVAAQVVQGSVLDAANGRPVPQAGVYLLDREHNSLVVAMADSLGRYALAVPDSGTYYLAAQRFGYRDTESPLLAISGDRTYGVDLELRPEPLGLGAINVTVRNDQMMDWLSRELGKSPAGDFGFRVLQGERLAEAKAKGHNNPTETLRWLYIPVSHGLECVSINAVPRAVTVGFRGPRTSAFGTSGQAPTGTVSMDQLRADYAGATTHPCGSLTINDRVVPNEQIEDVDMSSIAVVVTFLDAVRMYTYDFDWSFRSR